MGHRVVTLPPAPHGRVGPEKDSEAGALVTQPPQICQPLAPAIHLPMGTLGQSPSPRPATASAAAAAATATAATGAAAATPVLIDGDLDNPHATFHRIREQEPSRRKDLLILLLDVTGDLLENLLIVRLHAEEDEVGCGTGQAALQVGAAPNLLSLRIKTIEGLHGLFKELPLDPAIQLWGELGLELTGGTIAVVSLDKNLCGQRCASPELLEIVNLSGHLQRVLTTPGWLEVWSRGAVRGADSKSGWAG